MLLLQGFSAMNKLKRAALLLIASKMAPEEVAGLRSIFQVRALETVNPEPNMTAQEESTGLRSILQVRTHKSPPWTLNPGQHDAQ